MGSSVLEELADRQFVVRDLKRPGVCRGRITAMRHTDGVAVMAELRPETVATMAELGVPDAVSSLLTNSRGLVLFVGERGEGRSELLASVLAEMAKEQGRYVVALDDALDAPLPEGGALVTRRRIGEHATDYASGLRTTLREDPDAILLGSVDDADTFDLALRAAEGGRLVVAWMSAKSVVACLRRALFFYPAVDEPRVRQSLANALRAVCVRHLVASKTGSSMVPVTEWMTIGDAARDVLRHGELDSLTMLMRAEGNANGASLEQRLCVLARDSQIRVEDAYARAEDKSWLLDRLGAGSNQEVTL
jgi:twitching motility protein PilT